MQKSKLDKFIQKYNLGGNVNQVKWVSKDNKLSTSFVTPDKSLMGSVNVDNFTFEDVELGVYTTDQLMKLLNVLDDDVKLKVTKFGDRSVSLKAENGSVSFDYTLSDYQLFQIHLHLNGYLILELQLRLIQSLSIPLLKVRQLCLKQKLSQLLMPPGVTVVIILK